MHDGQQSNVMLFVPPGDTLTHVLDNPDPFVPVSFSIGTRLVSRAAIASLTVREVQPVDEDLPVERQRAVVHLRAGGKIEGELRWVAPPGRRRTLDYLNDGSNLLVVHGADATTYVAKAHIASVDEC